MFHGIIRALLSLYILSVYIYICKCMCIYIYTLCINIIYIYIVIGISQWQLAVKTPPSPAGKSALLFSPE